MKAKEINTIDLFCGAGGATTGLELALERRGLRHKGIAINHWKVAVSTMKENHPDVDTKCMSIEEAVPADLVPSGKVDILWASPSCTHHSRAKGGRPRQNQLRAQPELVLTWLDQLEVKRLIVENVPEFTEWGPLNSKGLPIPSKKGACFAAWVESIRARNYIVDWRVVNCADYGDATTRHRFFLKAVKRGYGKIEWPEPTHAEDPQEDLFGKRLKPWRGVKECLDFSDTGTSIFTRKKPLAKNTLRRIAVGLRKFCGLDFQMDMLGAGGPDECRLRTLEKPIPTQHTANRTAVVRPFVVQLRNHETAQDVEDPISTVSAGGQHHMLCNPLIVAHTRNGKANSADRPIGAVTTKDHFSVVQALVMDHFKGGDAIPADKPLGTQTTHDRYSVVTPLVLGQNGGAGCHPVDKPCPTIACKGAVRLITPVLVDMSHPASADEGRVTSASRPMKTATTRNNMAVVQPFVVDNANGGIIRGCHDPVNTITVKDQHMGIFPVLDDGRVIDIRIRMLKPSELAAAHSFPKDYVLTGNRGDQVKQIGNSVPVMTAAAMCECDLRRAS